MIPYLRIGNLKNHTLSGGTYLYSPYKGVPPPRGKKLYQFFIGNIYKYWQEWEFTRIGSFQKRFSLRIRHLPTCPFKGKGEWLSVFAEKTLQFERGKCGKHFNNTTQEPSSHVCEKYKFWDWDRRWQKSQTGKFPKEISLHRSFKVLATASWLSKHTFENSKLMLLNRRALAATEAWFAGIVTFV